MTDRVRSSCPSGDCRRPAAGRVCYSYVAPGCDDGGWFPRRASRFHLVCSSIASFGQRRNRINGNTLALATFTITYAVLAFVHLTGANYVSEGFYDFATLGPRTQAHHVYLALALVVLAQIGLWYGLAPTRRYPVSTRVHTLRVRSKLLVFAGIGFTALGLREHVSVLPGSGRIYR